MSFPIAPLVFRCSCGGDVQVPHGSPGGAASVIASVRAAHIEAGHHEVGLVEWRRIQASRAGRRR